eukprot:872532-Rhodomonas_salina.1
MPCQVSSAYHMRADCRVVSAKLVFVLRDCGCLSFSRHMAVSEIALDGTCWYWPGGPVPPPLHPPKCRTRNRIFSTICPRNAVSCI